MATNRPTSTPSALRVARLRAGWSQSDLSRATGIHPGTIGLSERTGVVSPRSAERIARALGIDPSDLCPEGDR